MNKRDKNERVEWKSTPEFEALHNSYWNIRRRTTEYTRSYCNKWKIWNEMKYAIKLWQNTTEHLNELEKHLFPSNFASTWYSIRFNQIALCLSHSADSSLFDFTSNEHIWRNIWLMHALLYCFVGDQRERDSSWIYKQFSLSFTFPHFSYLLRVPLVVILSKSVCACVRCVSINWFVRMCECM